ncbi:MAG: ferrous iron transport protein A [Spirochaetes bacterium]|uniref:Ferrous iron transport protein A n=1 Tax=Candidatus Ornithospirochaeta stercoripullorum TaxID=2840899 RepID=A0A9D9H6R9_9SPIO|nr:ferrous iron transport protein A [Candidatus Ornithospirochaeta stercoripullorum]
MPLSMIGSGKSGKIQRITGSGEIRRFLSGLGFIEGREVKVLSDIGGDVIVGILDSRVAINRDMARHIYV